MAAARGTPIRSFRRDEARWTDMVERAALEGRSTSELVNAAIDAYMETPIIPASARREPTEIPTEPIEVITA